MKVILTFDGRTESGGTPLLMHNERLSDPLDEYTRALAAVTGKRKKTEADHREMAHIEFLGGLYTNEDGPCIPSVNMLRCLEEAAKRHKRGRDVIRACVPLVEDVSLSYEGPRDIEQLWSEGYWLRKTVGVQQRRVMRTRPQFIEWAASLPMEVDASIFDVDTLQMIWGEAGKYVGLGDRRPINGRFKGSVVTDWQIEELADIDRHVYALSNAIRAGAIQDDDNARLERLGVPSDLAAATRESMSKVERCREAVEG